MTDFRPSKRANDAWKRFAVWYGADSLERKFGLSAPQDWCEVFDALDRDILARVMAEVKVKFPTWMPGLPEFEALIRQVGRPAPPQFGPTVAERLNDFVLAHRSLTPTQLRMPWRYIGRQFDAPGVDGKMRHNHGVEITGVIVPADGDHPGYRVLLEDLQQAAA